MATTTKMEVPPIQIGRLQVFLCGTSRLVTHRFGAKAIRQMLGKQMGEAKQGRDRKDPIADFVGGLHVMPGSKIFIHGEFTLDMIEDLLTQISEEDAPPQEVWAQGEFGFPGRAFKAAIVRAATDTGMHMTDIRRAVHIPQELIPIQCEPGPYLRVDMVRLESGVADVRFRPEFREWQAEVLVRFNRSVLSQQQLVNLIRTAGFGVGLCEGRPQGKKSSEDWGTFDCRKIVTLPDEGEE